MTYEEAMIDLLVAAYAAARAAPLVCGGPAVALNNIAGDIECLIAHGCTLAEHKEHARLKNAAKLAGAS